MKNTIRIFIALSLLASDYGLGEPRHTSPGGRNPASSRRPAAVSQPAEICVSLRLFEGRQQHMALEAKEEAAKSRLSNTGGLFGLIASSIVQKTEQLGSALSGKKLAESVFNTYFQEVRRGAPVNTNLCESKPSVACKVVPGDSAPEKGFRVVGAMPYRGECQQGIESFLILKKSSDRSMDSIMLRGAALAEPLKMLVPPEIRSPAALENLKKLEEQGYTFDRVSSENTEAAIRKIANSNIPGREEGDEMAMVITGEQLQTFRDIIPGIMANHIKAIPLGERHLPAVFTCREDVAAGWTSRIRLAQGDMPDLQRDALKYAGLDMGSFGLGALVLPSQCPVLNR